MAKKVFPEELTIKKLDNHDFSNFDCGDTDLNDFIRSDAKIQMKSKINITYVCIYNKKPVGFVTLSSDSIKINLEDKERIGIKYSAFPALKIGRLAVHKKYRKRSIGSLIILWVTGKALELCEEIGIRFISVDSYRKAEIFYMKNYFVKLEKSENEHIPMYSDLNHWE
ncbi:MULTISPECIES: GNAT family N-acetyltransferase [Methanobacterium]|jgi:GNAT superfamily N-acetyltransferase|uniref:GNAT family N-acetyltransferase n=1 Tax=Methanobacterium veterum TaxID=408577 RepID=A0A9E4ZVI3_9EURY|nr:MULTISPECIES: GNAT family N-acetyltransferase [Methanobacterium]MCZ3364403.1 GNAT family N-acetyltransferase [Methanobacterium veterum]MCZ3372154.1 GNAT family N-acetyltransferase [Methanobacterium veterum]